MLFGICVIHVEVICDDIIMTFEMTFGICAGLVNVGVIWDDIFITSEICRLYVVYGICTLTYVMAYGIKFTMTRYRNEITYSLTYDYRSTCNTYSPRSCHHQRIANFPRLKVHGLHDPPPFLAIKCVLTHP